MAETTEAQTGGGVEDRATYDKKMRLVSEGLFARYEHPVDLTQPFTLDDGRTGSWQLHEVDLDDGKLVIQPLLIDRDGHLMKGRDRENIRYLSRVRYGGEDDLLTDPQTHDLALVPVTFHSTAFEYFFKPLDGQESDPPGGRHYQIGGNRLILPDGYRIVPSKQSERFRKAREITTPSETSQGIPYLKADTGLLEAERPQNLPDELALSKQLVDDVLILSIISEGDYARYRQVYPDGPLTETEFSTKYAETAGKEFGNALVYTPDGSIIGYPGEEFDGVSNYSVTIDSFWKARYQETRSRLVPVGDVHSHPSGIHDIEDEKHPVDKAHPV